MSGLYEALAATGIPVTRVCWPKGKAPALPWAAFLLDGDDPLMADGRRYAQVNRWRVELYSPTRDAHREALIEEAIGRFGPWKRSEDWLEEENCLMVTYTFTEVEKENGNG